MDGLAGSRPSLVDLRYAWLRLGMALLLGTVGSVGMWSYVVALPAVQTAFAATRAEASVPYTFAMAGFAVGNLILGRLADRYGILVPILVSIVSLGFGYVAAGFAPTLWLLCAAHLLIGFGSAASFWSADRRPVARFQKRRGIAIAIVAAGNYVGGAIWPPVISHFIASVTAGVPRISASEFSACWPCRRWR